MNLSKERRNTKKVIVKHASIHFWIGCIFLDNCELSEADPSGVKMPNATRILGKMLDELMGNHRNTNPNDKVYCKQCKKNIQLFFPSLRFSPGGAELFAHITSLNIVLTVSSPTLKQTWDPAQRFTKTLSRLILMQCEIHILERLSTPKNCLSMPKGWSMTCRAK